MKNNSIIIYKNFSLCNSFYSRTIVLSSLIQRTSVFLHNNFELKIFRKVFASDLITIARILNYTECD